MVEISIGRPSDDSCSSTRWNVSRLRRASPQNGINPGDGRRQSRGDQLYVTHCAGLAWHERLSNYAAGRRGEGAGEPDARTDSWRTWIPIDHFLVSVVY